jgi:predicted HicB family RNase H-like nuclease
MRTTLDIDDGLLAQAKSLAAREHVSLTHVIEESLSLRLRAGKTRRAMPRAGLPVYRGSGGLQPRIRDTLSQRALLDAADDVQGGR